MQPVRWISVLSLMFVAASLLGGCRLVEAPAAPPVTPAAAVVQSISTAPTVQAVRSVAASQAAPTAVSTALPPVVPTASALAANKQAVEQFAAAWNTQDYAGMGTILDAGAVVANPGLPDLQSAQDYIERAKTVHAVIPTYQLTYTDVLAEGDLVLAREAFTGKIGPTPFTYTGMLLLVLQDGKIVDLYELSDELAVRKFLGEIPNDQKTANFGWQDAPDKTPAKPTAEPSAGTVDLVENKQIAQKIVEQWWAGAAAEQTLAAPDFTYHNPWSPEARTFAGRAQTMAQLQAALGDLTFELAGPIVADHDKVGFRFTLTGDRLALPGIAVYRIAGGKVAEEWVLWANTTLYSALNTN